MFFLYIQYISPSYGTLKQIFKDKETNEVLNSQALAAWSMALPTDPKNIEAILNKQCAGSQMTDSANRLRCFTERSVTIFKHKSNVDRMISLTAGCCVFRAETHTQSRLWRSLQSYVTPQRAPFE